MKNRLRRIACVAFSLIGLTCAMSFFCSNVQGTYIPCEENMGEPVEGCDIPIWGVEWCFSQYSGGWFKAWSSFYDCVNPNQKYLSCPAGSERYPGFYYFSLPGVPSSCQYPCKTCCNPSAGCTGNLADVGCVMDKFISINLAGQSGCPKDPPYPSGHYLPFYRVYAGQCPPPPLGDNFCGCTWPANGQYYNRVLRVAGSCGIVWARYVTRDLTGDEGNGDCVFDVEPSSGQHINLNTCGIDCNENPCANVPCATQDPDSCDCNCPEESSFIEGACIADDPEYVVNEVNCELCDYKEQFGELFPWVNFPDPPEIAADDFGYGVPLVSGLSNVEWLCGRAPQAEYFLDMGINGSFYWYPAFWSILGSSECPKNEKIYLENNITGRPFTTDNYYVKYHAEKVGDEACIGIAIEYDYEGFVGEIVDTAKASRPRGVNYKFQGGRQRSGRETIKGGYEKHSN